MNGFPQATLSVLLLLCVEGCASVQRGPDQVEQTQAAAIVAGAAAEIAESEEDGTGDTDESVETDPRRK
jgi:hypothetical protein